MRQPADAPVTGRAPPTAVVAAAWLLLAYGVLSLVRIWLFGSGLPASPTALAIWVGALGAIGAVARALHQGRAWARWLLVLAVGIALVAFPLRKPEIPQGPQLALYLLQLVMPIVAVALVFTARARSWFKA